jgi:hypothetical protein
MEATFFFLRINIDHERQMCGTINLRFQEHQMKGKRMSIHINNSLRLIDVYSNDHLLLCSCSYNND